ncbi:MAG: hypothetical protein LBG84_07965 [Treponema sp.]|jgi:hypothetical protein|nr:hypothetical protein [Treponema sp.]
MNDYLNLTDGDFDVFFKRLIQYAEQKCSGSPAAWTHIPAPERARLADAYTAWRAAYERTLVPHSKVETEAKNEAKQAGKTVIRSFVNRFLREDWEAVTTEDRLYLEIHVKDHTPTPHPAPEDKPAVEAAPSGKGKHTVTAINPQTGNKKKPALVRGAAFAHRVRGLNEPKNRAEDMPSVFQTGTSRDFQYGEESYGLTADYACAYEAENGLRGPWSDVVSVIIA